MTKLKLLVIVGLLGGGAWWFLNRETVPPQTEAEQPPVVRLSQFIDRYVDTILSPLTGGPLPIGTHDLRMLREQFRDQFENREGNPEAIRHSIRLCDTLLYAIDTREKFLVRFASAESVTPSPLIKDPQKRARDLEERRDFFVRGVNRNWMEETQRLRRMVNMDYERLRNIERQENLR